MQCHSDIHPRRQVARGPRCSRRIFPPQWHNPIVGDGDLDVPPYQIAPQAHFVSCLPLRRGVSRSDGGREPIQCIADTDYIHK